MAAKRDSFDPSRHFVLSDIALWTTSLRRDAEYQSAIHGGKTAVQTMRAVEAIEYEVVLEDIEGTHDMLRALISLGVRSVYRQGEAEESAVYTLEATFAAEYLIQERPSDEHLKEFVEFNCVHNVWPFWRQHVYDTLKRASLPVPLIPFFSGRSSVKRPKKVRGAPEKTSATS